mgnify:CR=1 FL=1
MVTKQKILIVDDDENIAELISLYLTKECFDTMIVHDGEEALTAFESYQPNLMLLDLMLPGIDGYQVCREIRSKHNTPIIMLSAKGEVFDKVLGLELGADDYIPKPFNPLELVARVKAQIRRYTQYNEGTKDEGDVIDFGGLFLNRQSHECTYNEVPLTLTPIEFDILWLLCENRGKVISSEELFEKVWHEKYYKNSNNTVMVHIRHLREKMSAPTGKSDFIKTVWGVGYKVEE